MTITPHMEALYGQMMLEKAISEGHAPSAPPVVNPRQQMRSPRVKSIIEGLEHGLTCAAIAADIGISASRVKQIVTDMGLRERVGRKYPTANCVICGSGFPMRSSGARYCGQKCKDEAKKQRRREKAALIARVRK